MTKRQRELAKRYTAQRSGGRDGNNQLWTVTRNVDHATAHVLTHAMSGEASAIERAIRENFWVLPDGTVTI